jgi:hypothetical protein
MVSRKIFLRVAVMWSDKLRKTHLTFNLPDLMVFQWKFLHYFPGGLEKADKRGQQLPLCYWLIKPVRQFNDEL